MRPWGQSTPREDLPPREVYFLHLSHFKKAIRRGSLRLLLPAALACAGCVRPAAAPRLTVVQGSDITTLDPNSAFEVVNDIVAMNIFDPLLRLDRHMNLQPALALRWENPSDRVWRIALRPGVRFHDGEPLSADDVVFSVRRVLAHPDSEIYPFLSAIRRIDARGTAVVEIETAEPTPLLTRLSVVYILPRRRLEREGEAKFFRAPVGTGPYRFVRWLPGDRVDVRAFSDYWGGAPSIPEASFRTVEKASARWSLAASARPTILLEGPREGWEEHRNDARFRLIARPSLTVSYLGANVSPRAGNPFSDLRVRQALRSAIDVPELLRRGMDRHGFPATQLVPPDVIGYNSSLPMPRPDAAEARLLLASAGYPNGIDVTLDTQGEGLTPLVRELVGQLAKASIRVTPRFWKKEEFFERIDRGLSDLHLSGWVCTSGESAELFESSLHTRSRGGLGRDNGTGYSNAVLDRLIERLGSTIDPSARVELEKRAMEIAVADLPLVPLYVQEDRYALTRDVEWEPRADGEIWLPEVRLR